MAGVAAVANKDLAGLHIDGQGHLFANYQYVAAEFGGPAAARNSRSLDLK